MNAALARDTAAIAHAEAMRDLLSAFLAIPSVSGHEAAFVSAVAAWARREGMDVDVWETDESVLRAYPEASARHLPLAGRPTAVLQVKGTGLGKRLLFNAHSDVVTPGDAAKWSCDPWGGLVRDGKAFGRGACDVKGPLVSALWAMKVLAANPPAGDVMLELVPGEEDSVGLGTLTSVARGYGCDGWVVLEPTESTPRCASRGGLRFEITIPGRAVHGTVKWLGDDAIARAGTVLRELGELEHAWTAVDADPLFSSYPITRPITVDAIHGGEWQGMVCDRCTVAGYFELLPGDDHRVWAGRFEAELKRRVPGELTVAWSENYGGHRTSPEGDICIAAENAVGPIAWQGFNSGCEAGLRPRLFGTPTLVWGPGSLAQAHAVDEFVDFAEVQLVAGDFVRFARAWCK